MAVPRCLTQNFAQPLFQQENTMPDERLDIPADRLPRHVAVIMDGNGRWAEKQGLPRIEGHRAGAASVRKITEECVRLGIEQLTLYCLSSENWKRPAEELDFLMQLLNHYLVEERPRVMEHNIQVRWIGRREELPDDAVRGLDELVECSAGNTGPRVCLAINYGGRAELVDAARRIAEDVARGELDPAAIDEEAISSRLYTAGLPDPDLLIRTAGEMRVSNFLLWQISYAEIWVTDVCWPDFREQQFRAALRDYASRRRRFGGLPEKCNC
ncbi:MAG: isoprenyl transferase [Pirellulales bacterium]|nr:isoprenyl transferase [Pirellulales bacterium]